MKMEFDYATMNEFQYIALFDKHIDRNILEQKIKSNEVLVSKEKEVTVGWIRFNYFWDNTPFMNMLWLEEKHRGKGIGKAFVEYWETQMKKENFRLVMTSSLANENAQHFYRKMGYKDSGCLMLEGEALEIIFVKDI